MSKTAALTIRLPMEARERLDRLAKDSELSPSRLAADAILAFLEAEERAREMIRAGLADADAGRVISHEEVARWLDTWGSEDELPAPKCG